ncbi:hypothetical protein HK105_200846 [Polyrhizophydium stewartii]|uniref:Elongation of fatty acids protein n=1 Tax=Polyrhizophydium stewartii TaxID=2732419 RepID=A0ABR4NK65_9FUNG
MAAESFRAAFANALHVPVEDTFIELVKAAGAVLGPYSKPLEDMLLATLNHHFPAQTAGFFRWVAAVQSPHTAKLPFMNPVHALFAVIAYFVIVFVGSAIMRPLPRFQLKTFSLLHNLFLTLLSAYMASATYIHAKRAGYKLLQFNNSVDHSDSGFPMAKIIWLFYFSKLPEFIDTFIMVLKKNFRQISFLHVFHHSSILVVQWFVVMMAPGGETCLSTILNSSVHVVMYGYYLLSALGIKSVSAIKRYITTMQMTQFVILFVQGIVDWYTPTYRPESASNYPPSLAIMLVFYMISMLVLFGNFFIQDKRRAEQAKLEAKLKAAKSL